MILVLLLSNLALAAVAPPKSVVEEIFSKASLPEVATDLSKQQEINEKVDFHALAMAALAPTAKAVNAKEVAWFRDTLREIITRTVYPKAPDFLQGVKITYDKVEQKANRVLVKSTVQNKADFTEVDYTLAKSKEGEWKVVDVSISGLSWVDSIEDQVRDTVKKKKWKGLKDAMNKRLAELRAGKV